MSRTDDIINVADHRLLMGALEEVLASHLDIAERVVAGVAGDIRGQLPLGFLVLKVGAGAENGLVVSEVVASIRVNNGSAAAFKCAVVVDRLPKVRSGKILPGTIVHIAHDTQWATPLPG
jgi:propionyl-CoA synthetase